MTCARREAGAHRAAPSTSADSPRKADPRTGRSRARLSLLLPVLALLAGALSPFAAAPAAAAVLVSNVGQTSQTDTPSINALGDAFAQHFTTGANAAGYTLTSIEFVFPTAVGTPANLRAELWSVDNSDDPNVKLASLTVPSSVSGTTSFNAPTGTTLDPNTSYFAVILRSGTTTGTVRQTGSISIDSGGQSGWSIETGSVYRTSGSWFNDANFVYSIRVNGEVKTTPLTASLSASPTRVAEGSSVTVTATVSKAPTSALTIPLTVTRITAEAGDFNAPSSIPIASGATTGTATITTAQDDDAEDEWFRVEFGTLPAGYEEGTPGYVRIKIEDDETPVSNGPKLTVEPFGNGKLKLTWTPGPGDGAGYNRYQIFWKSPDEHWGNAGRNGFDDVPLNARSHVITGLGNGTSYDVRMRAVRWGGLGNKSIVIGMGDYSNVVRATPGRRPGVPVLTVTPGVAKLDLSWMAASETLQYTLTGWTVQYADAAGYKAGTWTDVSHSGTGTTAAITGLTEGTSYKVRVAGVNAAGTGAFAESGFKRAGSATAVVTLSVPSTTVQENVGTVTVTATLDVGAAVNGTRVTLSTGGTASGADYRVSPSTITIAQGQTSGTFTITIVNDAHDDSGETIVLSARSGNPGLDSNTVTVTILNDGAPPEPGRLGGIALAAGSAPVALSPAFSPGVLSYRATVPAGTESVTLTPAWGGGVAGVHAGSRGYTNPQPVYTRPVRVSGSGTAVALGLAPDGGRTELWVMTRGPEGGWTTYEIEAVQAAPQLQVRAAPLTASFEQVPSEHDGAVFAFKARFSEAPEALAAGAFAATQAVVRRVRQIEEGLYWVYIAPKSWKRDVRVTLAGGRACDAAGAVCTADGRALSNTSSATVPGPVKIKVQGGKAREGKDAGLAFAVTLSRAAGAPVSVDYATKDGTAVAGSDYTATSGTLIFAAGETAKTVSVPILDDAHDEGKEKFTLTLSNASGARIVGGKASGQIRNEDPLQQDWLARFGRAAASDAIAAVTGRLETPRDAGSHVTLAGQRLNLSGDGQADGGRALADTLTGFARAFGAPGAPAWDKDDPFARHGLSDTRNDPVSGPARSMSGRELLMGTSFRAVLGQGGVSQFTSWGQGASVSRFSGTVPGLSLSGETATGSLGMDYERGRLLAGFAMTHSLGEGTAQGAGRSYAMGSTVTTVLPYARLQLSERLSAWGLAGTGTGGLTLDLDDDAARRHRTDLSMTLAAAGARGELLTPAEAGGFALALKADAFWVRTESDAVSAPGMGNLAGARADASRVRAVLHGSRTFALAGGGTLAPNLELGVRHDGGDAETGTGLELGAGLGFTDPSRGLDMALRVHGLAAHAGDGYGEWGVSGSLRFVPGGARRGLSASLTPSYGVDPGGSERLWGLPDASGLAGNGNADAAASSRLDAELGYGLPVFGGAFTGTPHVGFGLAGAARDYRIGWRLSPAASGAPGFEIGLDATRREAVNDNGAEHGVMLRSMLRW